MSEYKITFRLKSSTRTPFQADTLFGHFAWAMRYIYGEERLSVWLSAFDESPTLLSDAFPEGMIPRPLLRPLTIKESHELREEIGKDVKGGDIGFFDILKRMKKYRLVQEPVFNEVRGDLTPRSLARALYPQLTSDVKLPEPTLELVAHNTISRMTSSVLQGGFFHHEETFYPGDTRFYFYVCSDTLAEREIKAILSYIENSGFGADKSTGKGKIHIDEVKQITIEHSGDANAFMTLSSFIPDERCGTDGYYELFTKYGKLGGSYATAGNPFKKPVLMMRTGSVLKSSHNGRYGLLLRNIHTDPAIRHYACAFPLGVRLTDEEAT